MVGVGLASGDHRGRVVCLHLQVRYSIHYSNVDCWTTMVAVVAMLVALSASQSAVVLRPTISMMRSSFVVDPHECCC